MAYFAKLLVGYYDDDDTYHGPFQQTVELNTESIEIALRLAEERLQTEMNELNEPSPQGSILRIYDETGKPAYQHQLGILREICPPDKPTAEIIKLKDTISKELIAYLAKHPEEMYSIRPRQFEELLAEILASFGWQVQLTPPIKDGGFDIFAISKDTAGVRTSWIIECKKYRRDRKVGVDVARALYGAAGYLRRSNAAMMLATTSEFTMAAKEYACSKYNFELRDYESILEWVNKYKPNPSGRLYLSDGRVMIS